MTKVLISNWVKCYVVKRLSRFVVLVKVGNELVKAYLRNTGRLSNLLIKGRLGYCLPRRKSSGVTKYVLFAIDDVGGAALVDTLLQMSAFEEFMELRSIPWLSNCYVVRRNPKLGGSVLDYVIKCGDDNYLVEIKSAVLRTKEGCASYPDCLSLRGRRHVRELINYVVNGGKAMLIFIAALPNVKCFKPNEQADPLIPTLIKEARSKGVIIKSISMYFNPRESTVILGSNDLPVII